MLSVPSVGLRQDKRVKSEIKCNLVLGEGRFLIRLLEIMLLLTFPTMRAIDIHKTTALNLDYEVVTGGLGRVTGESPVALAFVVLWAPLAPVPVSTSA